MRKLYRLPYWSKKIIKTVSSYAQNKGFRAYLVGGVVRDLILKKEVFDLDIVIEGDAIELARQIAHHYNVEFRKHHAFGTATVYFQEHRVDFATARKEYYSHWGVLPKVFPAGLKEDLFRRDFTINSMAISLNNSDYGRLIDLCGGIFDLKNGLIRVLHRNSFLDDPTRILRAIRFEQRFSFRIEKRTLVLMKEAVAVNALSFVHLHRLRDELTLILKESKPYSFIKRLKELTGFSFIDKGIKLKQSNLKLILRIEKAVSFYKEKYPCQRKLDSWLIYFSAITIDLPSKRLHQFLDSLGLKKGEKKIIISIRANLFSVRKLERNLPPHRIFSFLNLLSFEAIVFFYAYYTERKIRDSIKFFLNKLIHCRLTVRVSDLKRIGFVYPNLYSRLMEKLLYAKMDKGLTTKKEELKEAKNILKRLR